MFFDVQGEDWGCAGAAQSPRLRGEAEPADSERSLRKASCDGGGGSHAALGTS